MIFKNVIRIPDPPSYATITILMTFHANKEDRKSLLFIEENSFPELKNFLQ